VTRRKKTKADRTPDSPHPGRTQGGNLVSIDSSGHTYAGAPSDAKRAKAESKAFGEHLAKRMEEMREKQAARREAQA
jgi:hypothetical protein